MSFTRSFNQSDLIEVPGGAPQDSLNYTKMEKSTYINKVLYRSHGKLNIRVDFGHDQLQAPEPANETFNPDLDFSDEFQANGTYMLERIYCKQRNKRSLVFVNLASSNVQKGSIKAIVDSGRYKDSHLYSEC